MSAGDYYPAIPTFNYKNIIVSGQIPLLPYQHSYGVANPISWEEIAKQNQRNTDYYKGLLIQIGEMFGQEAYTSDDGSIQQDVLCAKVPELVKNLMNSYQDNVKVICASGAIQSPNTTGFCKSGVAVNSKSLCAPSLPIPEEEKKVEEKPIRWREWF